MEIIFTMYLDKYLCSLYNTQSLSGSAIKVKAESLHQASGPHSPVEGAA